MKLNFPKVEATPTSMFSLAGYFLFLMIVAAFASIILEFVTGVLALGAIVSGIAGIILKANELRQ